MPIFSSSPRDFGKIGEGVDRLGQFELRVGPDRFVPDGVTAEGLLQLGNRADVTRADLGGVDVLLAPGEEEPADPLVDIAADVVDVLVALDAAGEGLEVGDASDEGVGRGVEDERPRGAGKLRVRCGEEVDDSVQDRPDAEQLDGRAADDRRHGPGDDALAEALLHLLLV